MANFDVGDSRLEQHISALENDSVSLEAASAFSSSRGEAEGESSWGHENIRLDDYL